MQLFKDRLILLSYLLQTYGVLFLTRDTIFFTRDAILHFQLFVNNAESLMRISRVLLGKRLFAYLMKKSFYGQFAGGENITELKPCVEKLAQHGVQSMLNFSVEADLSTAVGESMCEESLKTILEILDSSKHVCQSQPLSSFKITGLTTPQLLFQYTEVLEGIKTSFLEHSQVEKGGEFVGSLERGAREYESLLVNRVITREQFDALLPGCSHLFTEKDVERSGKLQFYKFREIIMENPELTTRLNQTPELTEDMVAGGKRLKSRLQQIAERTKSLDARIMIDAEQTYMQPAIDYFTLDLMREHNKETAYVYNTYQCYLKRTADSVTLDARDALQHGYMLGVKLVRGAYIVEETARAQKLGYENPVQDSKKDTDENYHALLDVVLALIVRRSGYILAGSHNEATVRYLMTRIQQLGIAPTSPRVIFGQLYGLCDPTTFQLASSGHNVLKAVAWGPVEAVLPFLARRAQENTGVLGSTTRELDLLRMELWRRMKGAE